MTKFCHQAIHKNPVLDVTLGAGKANTGSGAGKVSGLLVYPDNASC